MNRFLINFCLFLVLQAFASANAADPDIDSIRELSQQKSINFSDGVEAIIQLASIQPAQNSVENDSELLKEFKEIHNRLFVLTHMARLNQDIEGIQSSAPTDSMVVRNMNREIVRIKTYQKKLFNALLESISDKHISSESPLFLSLNELEQFGDSKSSESPISGGSFSRSFSKRMSKSGTVTGQYDNPLKSVLNHQRIMSPDWNSEKTRDLFRMIEGGEELLRRLEVRSSRVFENGLAKDLSIQESSAIENSTLSPQERVFLKRLGVSNERLRSKVDLSAQFRKPLLQKKSAACVGFAVASVVEQKLIQQSQLAVNEFISPWAIYGTFVYRERGDMPPSCVELDNQNEIMAKGEWPLHDGIYNVSWVLDSSNEEPLCILSNKPTREETGEIRVLSHQEYGQQREPISFNLFRALLGAGKAPVLLINSDARLETEDWSEIMPFGSYAHAIVVVGYGINDAINPRTLRPEPYLIVRDSLGGEPIHYKVPAKNLIEHSRSLIDIEQVERL